MDMDMGMSHDNATTEQVLVKEGLVSPDSLEVASEFISLACITVLAVALGAKTNGETLKTLNYGRFLVIMLYTLSWAFSATSVVLVSTNNSKLFYVKKIPGEAITHLSPFFQPILDNMTSCTLAMLTCDIFYAGSKIAIYAWLIERVHLVTAVKTTRFKTCQYRFHLVLLLPYVIILALMLTFRNIYLEPDGKCTIGLQHVASIPLLVYDFIFNLYLTWLFMRPLMNVGRNSRTDWKRSRLYKLARRTLVASVVCLLISFFNVLVVVITHGHERGLVCLTMCTVDVTVNVVTVHWVTTNSRKSEKHVYTTQKNMHTVDHMTAEMTFDDDANLKLDRKPVKYNIPTTVPERVESDSDSVRSASHISGKPLQGKK
ncbi:uncharacterized protein BYT42DRAFT_576444 [Radiomyces spectabilis]|uniref:uncharacterized protein n=1 Tax=Radiomyces spectabilis TaxID=64574 RepID=UPI00221F2B7C|nr:uncharacterized protein BYT42DRAFT_576444 [Radiomyces spectabilis]KAI8374459.1 hypothetical protein BYT42DRAFT_576444 [Radiomyces spectabilis]